MNSREVTIQTKEGIDIVEKRGYLDKIGNEYVLELADESGSITVPVSNVCMILEEYEDDE